MYLSKKVLYQHFALFFTLLGIASNLKTENHTFKNHSEKHPSLFKPEKWNNRYLVY